MREILNLRRENVDLERGMLSLPDSKTDRKTIVPALPQLRFWNPSSVMGFMSLRARTLTYHEPISKSLGPRRLSFHAFPT